MPGTIELSAVKQSLQANLASRNLEAIMVIILQHQPSPLPFKIFCKAVSYITWDIGLLGVCPAQG